MPASRKSSVFPSRTVRPVESNRRRLQRILRQMLAREKQADFKRLIHEEFQLYRRVIE
jgi:hypothetical protein